MDGQSIRYAWLDEVQSGAVDVDSLRQQVGRAWYPEDVEDALRTARTRPGKPLVLSVHSGHGPASVVRMRRIRQERWMADEYVFRTRLLGKPGDENRLAVVTITAPSPETVR